jgi:putative transposase
MIKAHKIRLNPTREQAAYFWKAAAAARVSFNWALAEYNKRKAEGQKVKLTGGGDCLIKEFVILKRTELAWVGEVSTYAYQGAFADLKAAISMYFKKKKDGLLKPPPGRKPRKDGQPYGWPRFKARDKTTPSFYQANTCLQFDNHRVKLPLIGWINIAEPLRFTGKVMGARVSYYANHWWLSVQVEVGEEVPTHNQDVVGVDLGIKYLAVTSDGQLFENPRPLAGLERKLARFQRSFSRMAKGGQNWRKMKNRIVKLHYRVACLRNEASHQLTTQLTRAYGIIGIEDLNIKGMLKNNHISKALSDAALYEKRRQLEYKAAWSGGQVVTVSRWFPSSKMCSGCGWINGNLKLEDREWTCLNCEQVNHRDGNAGLNIRNEAIRILKESGRSTYTDTLNACGAFSDSGAVKQEPTCATGLT